MFGSVREAFGKLDIFVSNARPEVPKFFQPPAEITLEQWDTAMDSQAKAFLVGAREAIALMPLVPSSVAPRARLCALQSVPFVRYCQIPQRAEALEHLGVRALGAAVRRAAHAPLRSSPCASTGLCAISPGSSAASGTVPGRSSATGSAFKYASSGNTS